jgi:hypothetical protein
MNYPVKSTLNRWLWALPLLCCLPGEAATIYKTVDENGMVSFSDTLPPGDTPVETVIIEEQAAPPSELTEQRLKDMRETTDRMVADRMAREEHRAELRRLEAEAEAQQSAQEVSEYYDYPTVYWGNTYDPVRRPWRRHDHRRPAQPIAGPPLRPPAQNLPRTELTGNNYPASLIRRGYDPKVRAALR